MPSPGKSGPCRKATIAKMNSLAERCEHAENALLTTNEHLQPAMYP